MFRHVFKKCCKISRPLACEKEKKTLNWPFVFDLNPIGLQQVEHTIRTAKGNQQVKFSLLSLPLYGVQELGRIIKNNVLM